MDTAIARLRFAHCLRYVDQHHGRAAELLAKQAIIQGCVSEAEASAGALKQPTELLVDPHRGDAPLTHADFSRAWSSLVQDRLLVRASGVPVPAESLSGKRLALVTPPDNVIGPADGDDGDSDDEQQVTSAALAAAAKSTKRTGRAATKAAGGGATGALARATASRTAAAAASTALRAGAPAPTLAGSTAKANAKKGGAAAGAAAAEGSLGGRKRARERPPRHTSSLMDDEELNGVEDPSTLLWRFNSVAVLRAMRHESLVQYTREKLSPRAAQVVAVMLHHGNAHEQGCSADSGPDISAQDVHATLKAEVQQRAAGKSPLSETVLAKIGSENLSWEQLLKVLAVLQNACGGIVQRVSSGADGGRWSVQMGAIVDDLREATLMDLLTQQQGLEAARIVRLLVQRGSLTDQMVADAALLDVKVARGKLYSLFALGVLGQQALPKFSNHMPQHTIYLWKADWEALQRSSTNLVYRILMNLRVRRHKEAKRYERLAAAERSAADAEAHTAALSAVVAAVDKLDAAVLHLDKTLMLLTAW